MLLRITEVCERLRLGRTTVLRLIKEQELACVREGRAVRVPEGALTTYIEKRLNEQRVKKGGQRQ